MTRVPPPHPRSRPGFTLIEAIATISILATLSVISSRLILESSARYSDTTVRAELNTRASGAMQRIVHELRSMQKNSTTIVPSIDPAFSATSVTFNNTSGVATTISYDPAGGSIFITIGGTTSTLLSNCSAFVLAYADKDNAAVSPGGSRDNIRRVSITITTTQAGVSETIRTRVYIRAMMSGSGAA
jgi:prepilin-type N-terminal cleavage/methylation domain-containing protein